MRIITFHNVIEDKDYDLFDSGLFTRISATEFRKGFEYLQSRYNFISLSEMVAALNAGHTIPDAASITFDDCYHSVIKSALPVLESFGVSATLFAVTSYLDTDSTNCFRFDHLEIAFRLSTSVTLDCTELSIDLPELQLDTVTKKLYCLWKIKNYLKILPKNIADDTYFEILKRLKVSEGAITDYALKHPKYKPMIWNDLRKMKDNGNLIGSHSVTHSSLPLLPKTDVYSEIVKSRNTIIDKLQVDWLPFAYPFGKEEHFSPEIQRIVSSAGYECAVTAVPGINTIKTDLFGLYRCELDQEGL